MSASMKLAVAGLLFSGCMMPMHDPGSSMMMGGDGTGRGMSMEMWKPVWPTIRIDGLDGAHVTMERGIFGLAIDVRAPFQGSFQPTGDFQLAGYPLDIVLDEATSRRYGSEHEIHLKGRLTVPEEASHEHGILRIDPSECALRALLRGDIDKLAVESEQLPTADVACAHREGMHATSCAMPSSHHGCGDMKSEDHDHGVFGLRHGHRYAELTLTVAK